MSEFLKNMNALTATAAVTAAFGAAEAPAVAHDRPVGEGQTQSEAEYERAIQEYCEGEAFGLKPGKILDIDLDVDGYKNGGFLEVEGTTTDASDPDCDERAERIKTVIDVVQVLPGGKVRDLARDLVIKGDESEQIDHTFNLRGWKGDRKSRVLALRKRITGEVQGQMSTQTSYGHRMRQNRR